MGLNEILKETRKWIQWNCINGDRVEWNSRDFLRPYITVDKLEKFALGITSPLLNKIKILENKIKRLENKIKRLENDI